MLSFTIVASTLVGGTPDGDATQLWGVLGPASRVGVMARYGSSFDDILYAWEDGRFEQLSQVGAPGPHRDWSGPRLMSYNAHGDLLLRDVTGSGGHLFIWRDPQLHLVADGAVDAQSASPLDDLGRTLTVQQWDADWPEGALLEVSIEGARVLLERSSELDGYEHCSTFADTRLFANDHLVLRANCGGDELLFAGQSDDLRAVTELGSTQIDGEPMRQVEVGAVSAEGALVVYGAPESSAPDDVFLTALFADTGAGLTLRHHPDQPVDGELWNAPEGRNTAFGPSGELVYTAVHYVDYGPERAALMVDEGQGPRVVLRTGDALGGEQVGPRLGSLEMNRHGQVALQDLERILIGTPEAMEVLTLPDELEVGGETHPVLWASLVGLNDQSQLLARVYVDEGLDSALVLFQLEEPDPIGEELDETTPGCGGCAAGTRQAGAWWLLSLALLCRRRERARDVWARAGKTGGKRRIVA